LKFNIHFEKEDAGVAALAMAMILLILGIGYVAAQIPSKVKNAARNFSANRETVAPTTEIRVLPVSFAAGVTQ
jgi:ABC-type molybdate transport system permease subunit